MPRFWILTFWLSLALLSLPAQAQTFEDGYQSYVRNQFPVAEFQFKSALKKVNSDEERGYILKFIGICQFMRGDKRNASTSFSQALGYDRSLSIDSDEVLDPSVVTFFNSIKSRMPPDTKRKTKAVAQAPVQQPEPAHPAAAAAPKRKVKKTKKKGDSILAFQDDMNFDEKPRKIGFLHFLPFGAPQFANGSYLIGSGFAGLQAYAIYSMYDSDKLIKERQDLNSVVRNKDGLTDDQRNSFYSDNNAYISDLKKQKNLALAGFGVLWAISVAEGIINNKGASAKTADEPRPAEPKSSIAPIIQANKDGGAFGIMFQTQLK